MDKNLLLFLVSLAFTVVIAVKYLLARKDLPTWPATLVIIVLSVVVFINTLYPPLKTHINTGRRSTFHYFLGSKYFSELGYHGLYKFALLADVESKQFATKGVKRFRKLEDYTYISRREMLKQARAEKDQRFTPERWEEFKADWVGMSRPNDGSRWRRLMNDHGFNPPPAWNLIPGFVAQFVHTTDKQAFIWTRNADLILIGLALIFCGVICGIEVPFIVFSFMMTAWYNEGYQVATFFVFFWLFALITGMTFLRWGKEKIAAVFFAISAVWRIFPTFLMAGPGITWLRDLVKERKLPGKKTAFLAVFAVACGIYLLLGLTQGHGPKSTAQFFKNISMHKEEIQFHGNKFGIKTGITDHPGMPRANNALREKNMRDHIWAYRTFWAAVFCLTVAAIWVGRKDDDHWAIPLSMGFIFLLLTISRYYYLVLVVYLIPGKHLRNSGFAAYAAGTLFVANSLFHLADYLDLGFRPTFSLGVKGFVFAFVTFPIFLLVAHWRDKRRSRVDGEDGIWDTTLPDHKPPKPEPAEH